MRPSPLTASTIQGLPLDLLDRLRNFPLFLSAPDSFLAAIGTHLRPQLYQPHDYILTEGDDAKAMYWLVRGAVRVTSRDGESTYAELKPGAFFGEIGILMDIPRTATIVANLRSLVVRLNKEDLQKELPNYPAVERAIREEAVERLAILERKKKESGYGASVDPAKGSARSAKRPRDRMAGDVEMGDVGAVRDGEALSNKKRKSPSPSLADAAASSAIGSGPLTIRQLLKELPLFSGLPPEILHFLGVNAQPRTYPPFTDIIKQNSQGRDVYFIVKGEVEVVTEKPTDKHHMTAARTPGTVTGGPHQVKARLKPGQYFGEVTSLSLAPRRTATVRTISSVECLMISGNVLDELWQRCSPDLRRQVECEARRRLQAAEDGDVVMVDVVDGTPAINELAIADIGPRISTKSGTSRVTFSDETRESPETSEDEKPVIEPSDPDPFLSIGLDNIRSRSRRGSLALPSPSGPQVSPNDSQNRTSPSLSPPTTSSSPLKPRSKPVHEATTPERQKSLKRPKVIHRRPSRHGKGILPDKMLVSVFQYLDVYRLMQLRLVSMHWLKLLSSSPEILHTLDLTPYNRHITDAVLSNIICPFVGPRPRFIDLSNCFHVTDEGFGVLASTCGANVTAWRMKSVWDVTGQAVLDMSNKAKGLEEIDLSNCRKVTDNLLARIVGWVVPEMQTQTQQSQQQQHRGHPMKTRNGVRQPAPNQVQNQQAQQVPADTATEVLSLGCPNLTHLNVAFCGSAVSDSSLRSIGLHLLELKQLSVRGCVRVTGTGVEAVVDGCRELEFFDVSQCKNLKGWLDGGGIERKGRGVRFETVADGRWRDHR
ncbi:hypothetical protein B0A49_05039 [Cryomyces minteri]|uniref:Cyclic nucleotide-binding domain-containing protein n=1 Tax=Cryomyces minteri TaxID=331657 RepID=A0A4U0XH90_9PEZI|nr:hypothetical protein B0A49_05039 [Cryomyces minteri]